jgi:hypothetical protein
MRKKIIIKNKKPGWTGLPCPQTTFITHCWKISTSVEDNKICANIKSISRPLLLASRWGLKARVGLPWNDCFLWKGKRHRLIRSRGSLSKSPSKARLSRVGGAFLERWAPLARSALALPGAAQRPPQTTPIFPRQLGRAARSPLPSPCRVGSVRTGASPGSPAPGSQAGAAAVAAVARPRTSLRSGRPAPSWCWISSWSRPRVSPLRGPGRGGGTGCEGVRAAEAERRLRPRGAKEQRGAEDNPNRKGCDDGRAGARRRAFFLRGRRGCSGAGRRLLTWSRPGSRRPAPLPPHPWPAARQSPGRSRARPPFSAAARPAWPGHPGPVSAPPVALSPDARCRLPWASDPGPQRSVEQAASRGSSAGRGGGGSWASAERAARCACAPPPPPPAGGLNHPPPRTRGSSWRTRGLSGPRLQPCHSQLPQCGFGFACIWARNGTSRQRLSQWQDDN